MDHSDTEPVDQRLESVPWEHLLRAPADPRRRIVLVLFAVAAAVIAASAAKTLWPAPALSAASEVSSETQFEAVPAAATDIQAATDGQAATDVQTGGNVATSTVPQPMSEADLRAVSADDASRTAVAYAELFVSQWLTLDGGTTEALDRMLPSGLAGSAVDPSARSFVESAIGMSATEIGFSMWQVEVVVRSLSAFAEGDYVRVPPRAFAVTVRITDEGPAIVDLPSPTQLPVAQVAPVSTLPGEAPSIVVDGALSVLELVGLVDESSLSASRAGDVWRVDGVVRDIAGVPVRVVVWLDEQGRQVTVPPIG